MIPLILKVLPWKHIAAAAAGAAVIGGIYLWGYGAGKDAVRADWDKERITTAQKHAEAVERVLASQQAIQSMLDQARRDRKHDEDRINRLHAAAVDSLRDRPERPAGGVPDAAGSGGIASGCTGANLYREDAAVALGIARDADLVRAALAECRAGYQAARERLGQVGPGGSP
jgi:hypothetical protein